MPLHEFDARIDAAVTIAVAAAMKQHRAETDADITIIKEAAVATKAECARLTAKCSALENSLSRAHQRYDKLRAALVEVFGDYSDGFDMVAAALEEVVLELNRTNTRTTELEDRTSKPSEAPETKLNDRCTRLERDLAQAVERCSSLECDFASTNKAATESKERLQERCAAIEASLARTLGDIKVEEQRLDDRCSALQQQLTHSTENIEVIQSGIERQLYPLKQEIARIDKTATATEVNQPKLGAQCEALSDNVAELENKCSSAMYRLGVAEKAAVETEKHHSMRAWRLEMELRVARRIAESAKAGVTKLNEHCDHLRQEMKYPPNSPPTATTRAIARRYGH